MVTNVSSTYMSALFNQPPEVQPINILTSIRQYWNLSKMNA